MGYSFSNIQIKNEDDRICPEQILEILLAGQKIKPAEQCEQADIIIAVSGKSGSPWMTVVSDLFDEDAEKSILLAKELSGKLETPVISISGFDSDYLFLNLHDVPSSTDAWASCGHFPYGKAARRSNFQAWNSYVADVQAFRSVMRKSYIFAEECLSSLESLLHLPASQSACCIQSAVDDSDFTCFYYQSEAVEKLNDPPRFEVSRPEYSYHTGKPVIVSFLNRGGPSRGVAIYLNGPCVASQQVEVEYLKLEMHDTRGEWIFTHAELKEKNEDLQVKCLYAILPQVRIPKAVPDGLPPKKTMDLEFEREITVRFQLKWSWRIWRSDQPAGPLQVTLVPLENPGGQCSHLLRPPFETLL